MTSSHNEKITKVTGGATGSRKSNDALGSVQPQQQMHRMHERAELRQKRDTWRYLCS